MCVWVTWTIPASPLGQKVRPGVCAPPPPPQSTCVESLLRLLISHHILLDQEIFNKISLFWVMSLIVHFHLFSIRLQTTLQVCNMNLLNKSPPPLTSVPILQTNSPIKKACSFLLFQPKLRINFYHYQSAQVQMKINGYTD